MPTHKVKMHPKDTHNCTSGNSHPHKTFLSGASCWVQVTPFIAASLDTAVRTLPESLLTDMVGQPIYFYFEVERLVFIVLFHFMTSVNPLYWHSALQCNGQPRLSSVERWTESGGFPEAPHVLEL